MSKTKEQCLSIIEEKFLNLETDLSSKLLIVEKTIKEISGAEYGFIYLYNEENNQLKFLIEGKELDIPIASSIAEEVLLTKKGFFDNYTVSHKRYNQKVDNPLNIKIKSLLLVPIFDKEKERVIGLISAMNSVNHIQNFKRYDIRCLGFLNSKIREIIKLFQKGNSIYENKQTPLKESKKSLPPETKNPETKKTENKKTEVEKLLLKLSAQEEKIKELEQQLLLKKENVSDDVLVIDEALYQETNKSTKLKDILEFLTNEVTYLAHEEHKIYLFLEIIKNSLHNKEQLNFINHMLDKSKLVHKLANDLYNREKMPMLYEEFDIYQLISSITNLFASPYKEENITFNVFINPHIPRLLYSDMMKLKSLITHLLNNVYGLVNSGGVIELSIDYIQEKEFLNIEVKAIRYTSGKDIKKLFQSNPISSYSLTSADSGLGLSVSSNLINILNGKLKLSTFGDDEHSFCVTVPVKMVKEVNKKDFSSKKKIKIAILMDKENKHAAQNLIRYCQSMGIKERDIIVFSDYKKMSNMKFSHLFCFENMLSKVMNSSNCSCLIILKYTTSKIQKDSFDNKKIYDFYINSYYGQELQELFFPDTISEKVLGKTLLIEDSFLKKFNKIVNKLKLS